MDFEEFKEKLVDDVQEGLYGRGIDDVQIFTKHTDKLNSSYETLMAQQEGVPCGVCINMNAVFAEVMKGNPYDAVLDQVINAVVTGIEQAPAYDAEELMDYEKMKDKLCVEVVSAERNALVLSDVPHRTMEDMAVVYRVQVDKNEDGRSTFLVTNHLMEVFGVTPEQLHEDAMRNSPEIRPIVIAGMREVLADTNNPEIMDYLETHESEPEVMYVATVPDRISGAGVVAYQNFMDEAAERLGGDFYILPSSVHELILLPDDGKMDYRELTSMVEMVNNTQVEPEDRLTYNVYHYDSKEHVFELAEKFDARVQERLAAKEEKASVLQELKEKQKDVEKSAPVKKTVEKAVKNKGEEVL